MRPNFIPIKLSYILWKKMLNSSQILVLGLSIHQVHNHWSDSLIVYTHACILPNVPQQLQIVLVLVYVLV